uniref:AN1-type domain-containing protein n=1 Tax=viral metagenome TaxID=1070528 RepID=A0A6C0D787_9ZZZZ
MTHRCSHNTCKRKLPLTAFTCRCNLYYCDQHRMPEDHSCSYNYFEENQKKMKENLSTIIFKKSDLILSKS